MTNKMTEDKNAIDEKVRYDLMVNARNFHYENFNKWMTYYYVAVAAIFVAFYSLADCNDSTKLCLLIIGYIVSILWHLSCKGYYFWVKHWTAQLLKMEKSNNYEVYSIFSESVVKNENKLLYPLQSANISTSKATLFFSFITALAWSFLILKELITVFSNSVLNTVLNIIISIIVTLILCLIFGFFLKSNLKNHKLV